MTIIGRITKSSLAAGVLVGLTLTLSGCGGEHDGDYSNAEGQLTIKDSTATYIEFTCSESGGAELEGEIESSGELTEDGTQIMWSREYSDLNGKTPKAADPIVANKSGELLTVGEHQFRRMDTEDALEAYALEEC